ncbi:hypothetical protein [Edaphobacter bradus]|uniref:hypothetical protein n=1 Tax=Edaphobacter bradus TaxID=2259016 RepID=UPI0021DFD879|nr:hypothetical protein [Edaphobacter bradus]
MGNYTNGTVPIRFTETKRTNLARELFTSNFWISGLAMLKYIPRWFRVKQVDGMAFVSDTKYDEFQNRILQITPANPRQWGTMNVSQMLHHLNLACGALGFYKLPDESYLVSRTLFRWILVDWFPEQPVGLRLPKGFKIPHPRGLTLISKTATAENPGCRLACKVGRRLGRTPCSAR